MDYVLKYDSNSGLWTVLSRPIGGSYWTQVSKWYKYRAYAEHKLEKLRGTEKETKK